MARSPASQPPAARVERQRAPVLALVVSLLALLTVGVGIILVATRKQQSPADKGVAPTAGEDAFIRLAGMKSKAEEMALHKHLADAHAQYDRLLADPAASGPNDAKLRDLVTAARADQSRIYEALVHAGPQPSDAAGRAPNTTEDLPDRNSPRGRTSQPSPGVSGDVKSAMPAVNPYAEADSAAPIPAESRPSPPTPQKAPELVVVPIPDPVASVSPDNLDTAIDASMRRAVDVLLSAFKDGELVPALGTGKSLHAGTHALCVYALLEASRSLDDDRLNIRGKIIPAMIEAMKRHDLADPAPDGSFSSTRPVTYAHSLRAAALAVYDRPEDRKVLRADVKWLVDAALDGAYSYDNWGAAAGTPEARQNWDNSNSQYGLLGVWAGAEAGVEVPTHYWSAVEKHWRTTNQPDGRWLYSVREPKSSLSMTCGGVASLMVTYDYLDVPRLGGAVGHDPYPGRLGRGLSWLENASNVIEEPTTGVWWGYDYFSVERVGLATGLKYLGTHDWYRELARIALKYQFPSGVFGDDKLDDDSLVETAYCLLFMARGRHPVMMEKLRFKGFWDNRPRDLANLTKYASRELERQLNWQVVSADRPWQDWFDSPVLFIASHQPPQLTEENYANLRGFVEAGGLILTQSDASSTDFAKWVPELVKKVCPRYELKELPPTDLLFRTNYRITAPPKLLAVSNGSRLLVVHSPVDLSVAWQRQERVSAKASYQLGINVFVYASGKREMRNRVASLVVPEPTGEPSRKVAVARVSYSGDWDPEPYAWKRISNEIQNASGVALDLRTVPMDALATETAPLAYLTGTAKWTFNDAQCAALASYVKAGGVLLIDSTGGQDPFARSVEGDLLPRAFPGVKLTVMPDGDPVMKDITLALRPYAMNLMSKPPALRMAKVGQGYVIFSPIDINSGLLGTGTWGIVGYSPPVCEQIVKNLVAWAPTVRRKG